MGDRKRQADIEAELEIMKRDLNSLRAAVEDNQELTTRAIRRLDNLEKTSTTRLNDFEARLDQELAKVEGARRPSPAVSPPEGAKMPSPVEVKAPPPSEAPPGQVPSDVERSYREGYEALKAGDLDGAREKFLSFLKEHPDTPLSDNAQFWIGEIYFKKHQYEAAILAYEDVIKKYPNSNKLPDTLLKQGLAFLELGDKIDARIILENLIKKYPTSEQARIAKGTLKTLK
ncbi:MAG: tol-pal system protein YbgF [Proteobacteria bacterium]|nr:tol-pal system protein YbgF [Pseudomonadota bacterium]